MASRDASFNLAAEELAQFEDVDLYEDEKEYVKAEDEELEEEDDDEDEYNDAREAEAEGPAEYAQKWPAGKTGAQAAYQHEEEKTRKEEKKTYKEEKIPHKEEKKTHDDGFEKAELHHPATEGSASEVDEEVVHMDAQSNAVQ